MSVARANATLQTSTSRLTASGEKANLPLLSLAMWTSTGARPIRKQSPATSQTFQARVFRASACLRAASYAEKAWPPCGGGRAVVRAAAGRGGRCAAVALVLLTEGGVPGSPFGGAALPLLLAGPYRARGGSPGGSPGGEPFIECSRPPTAPPPPPPPS